MLHSLQLWLPPSSLKCPQEFEYWASCCLAANSLQLDLCDGLISFEEYLAGCEHYGVDVDELRENIDTEITLLGG